jgi:hypothetical protein
MADTLAPSDHLRTAPVMNLGQLQEPSNSIAADGYVTVRLSPKAARNLEVLLNRAAVGPYFTVLQVVTGFAAFAFACAGGGAVYKGLEVAEGGHMKPALLLILWGLLATMAGGASATQQLAIVSALQRAARRAQ